MLCKIRNFTEGKHSRLLLRNLVLASDDRKYYQIDLLKRILQDTVLSLC